MKPENTLYGDVETETCLDLDEARDFDKGFLVQQNLQSAVNVENLDRDSQFLLSGAEIESLDEKIVPDNKTEKRVDVVDKSTSSFANTLETRLNATILGTGNLVAMLAGENLARPIAADPFDVGDSPAVLAVGDVISERRSNSATATALDIDFDINTVVAFTFGDTANSLASRAGWLVTPLLGEALRATSVWEAPTYSIALGMGWVADTVGRVLARRRGIASLASKAARVADATEGTSIAWIATLLLALLVLDQSGEVVTGAIPTSSVDDLLRHWVAVKEPRKNGQAQTDVNMSRNKVLAGKANIDIDIQSGTDVNEALLHVSLPRLENVPGPRGTDHGAREE